MIKSNFRVPDHRIPDHRQAQRVKLRQQNRRQSLLNPDEPKLGFRQTFMRATEKKRESGGDVSIRHYIDQFEGRFLDTGRDLIAFNKRRSNSRNAKLRHLHEMIETHLNRPPPKAVPERNSPEPNSPNRSRSGSVSSGTRSRSGSVYSDAKPRLGGRRKSSFLQVPVIYRRESVERRSSEETDVVGDLDGREVFGKRLGPKFRIDRTKSLFDAAEFHKQTEHLRRGSMHRYTACGVLILLTINT